MTPQMSYHNCARRAMALRADLLKLTVGDLDAAHGLLIGITCAIERMRGRERGNDRHPEVFAQADQLQKELRESDGPL